MDQGQEVNDLLLSCMGQELQKCDVKATANMQSIKNVIFTKQSSQSASFLRSH